MAKIYGKKVPENELKNIDPSKIAKTKPYVEGEVEGQDTYLDVVTCECCGASRVVLMDTEAWTYFSCSCGCYNRRV